MLAVLGGIIGPELIMMIRVPPRVEVDLVAPDAAWNQYSREQESPLEPQNQTVRSILKVNLKQT